MRLDLETEIRYPSGERAGFLRKVLLDESNDARDVVMETDDLISRRVLVPVSLLSEGPGDVLYINIAPNKLDTLQDYREERVPAVNGGWEFNENHVPGGEVFPATMYEPILPIVEVGNAPEAALSITQGTERWCLEERWGLVDEVIVDESGHTQALVGRPDDIEEHDRLIPIGLVREADGNRVVLNCTVADLATYTEELVSELEEPEEF